MMFDIRKNDLLFRKMTCFMINKRGSIVLEQENGYNPLISLMESNVVQLGFSFSQELKDTLTTLSDNTLEIVYDALLFALKQEKGANVNQKNFLFPNFPAQTRMTSLEKLSNLRFAGYLATLFEGDEKEQFLTYLGLGKYAEHIERTPLEIDMDELIPIKSVTMDDFYTVVCNLLSSRAALSEYDKNYIRFFLTCPELNKTRMVPSEIPFKETWAFLFEFAVRNSLEIPLEFKNFYDFERAYASLLGYDVSLSSNMRLKNLPNKERIILLSMLEDGIKKYPKFMMESAYKNRNFVQIVSNRLHPSSYGKRFPLVCELFDKVTSEKYETDEAKIERLLSEKKGLEAIKVAIFNPGLSIRRLSYALSVESNVENQKQIIELVSKKASEVDASVLLNAKSYFDAYIEALGKSNIRVAMPKGNLRNAYFFVDEKNLSVEICKLAIEMLQKSVEKRLSTKEKLGKVYIDDVLKNYNVPFATRNESSSFRTVARGSKIKISEKHNVIRAFVYKKYCREIFVDLSCVFLDDAFNQKEECSWQHLKTDGTRPVAMHSGDSNQVLNGFSEFLDIDLEVLDEMAQNYGYRYVAFNVLSYNHVPFNLMECFFGIMGRSSMFNDKVRNGTNPTHPIFYHMLSDAEKEALDFKGEVFEPSTVEFRFDLNDNHTVNMPLIYDIQKREFIWTDMAIHNTNESNSKKPMVSDNAMFYGSLTVNNLRNGIKAACYSMVHLKKPNIYDLVVMNVNARGGQIVDTRDEADMVWSLDGDVTPFYRDIITKNWM